MIIAIFFESRIYNFRININKKSQTVLLYNSFLDKLKK